MIRLTHYCLIGVSLMTTGCKDEAKQASTSSIAATVDGISYHGMYREHQFEDYVEIVSPIALSLGERVSVSRADKNGLGFVFLGDDGVKFAGKAGEIILIHDGQPLPYEVSVDIQHKDSEAARNSISAALTKLTNRTEEQAGTGQPATNPESKSEGGDIPQPEAEGRSR